MTVAAEKIFIMTVCVLLTMSGFQKDCQAIIVRLKESFLSRSVHMMQVLHTIILNFNFFGRHTV